MGPVGDYIKDTVGNVMGTRPDLDDVLAGMTVNNYTPAETAEIRQVVTDIYNGSELGREMLRDAMEDGGTGINFDRRDSGGLVTDDAYAYAGTGNVHVDMNYLPQLTGIDENGNSFVMSDTYVLTHELVHALTGRLDIGRFDPVNPDPDDPNRAAGKHFRDNGDYQGDTERFTKRIMDELGQPDYRASYDSATDLSGIIPPGTSFTNGRAIDNAIVSHNGTVDTRNGRSSDDDLVVDLSSDYTVSPIGTAIPGINSNPGARGNIRTGRGDDVVHARGGDDDIDTGRGDDVVKAGTGDDNIVDGMGDDIYDGGADIDTLDFSVRQAAPMDVVIGDTGMVFTRNRGMFRADEVDTATEVEVVTLPAGVQTARIEGLEATSYIDMGAGEDLAVIGTELDDAYVLDLTDGRIPAGEPGAGQAYSASVSNGTETIYLNGVADENIRDERSAAGKTELTIDEVDEELTRIAQQDPAILKALADNPETARAIPEVLEELKTQGVETLEFEEPLPNVASERFGTILNEAASTHREVTAEAERAVEPVAPETPAPGIVHTEDELDYAL